MANPDPQYLEAQIHCVRALVLGLANLLVDREEFREESLKRLESLRTAWHALPIADEYLRAVDDHEEWLKHLTSP